jgi:two-component system sensor kinase FixL
MAHSATMAKRSSDNSEVEALRRRLSALEAASAGLGLAQVLTRTFPGEIRSWSRGMERLYGYSATQAIGAISHELLRTEFPQSRQAMERELLERDEWTGELRHRRSDGQDVVVVSHQSLQRVSDAPLVTEVNNDITGEWRGREARLYLASIVESSDEAIIGKTLHGVVTTWNQAAEAIFGYTAEEMIGQPITLLHPSDRQHEEAMFLERLRHGERIRHFETLRLHKNGSVIAVSLTISPILASSGQIIGASKIVRDITAERRNQSRIQELQSELVHVARLSTLGQMASAIAHELNQPLTAVGNYAGALERLLSAGNANPERVGQIVDRIRQQTTRAGDVIRRLRDHVAKRGTQRRPEKLNAVVEEAVGLGLVGTAHQEMATRFILDDAVGAAVIDRVQIGQVIINLVRNAVEAMESSKRRELTVSTHAVVGAVEIKVSDTGPGIAPEVAERLFQPFVTSKPTGLGLGLSICREIVEAHGGELSAASIPSGGTTFTLRLSA